MKTLSEKLQKNSIVNEDKYTRLDTYDRNSFKRTRGHVERMMRLCEIILEVVDGLPDFLNKTAKKYPKLRVLGAVASFDRDFNRISISCNFKEEEDFKPMAEEIVEWLGNINKELKDVDVSFGDTIGNLPPDVAFPDSGRIDIDFAHWNYPLAILQVNNNVQDQNKDF